jgi:hypothetical protein
VAVAAADDDENFQEDEGSVALLAFNVARALQAADKVVAEMDIEDKHVLSGSENGAEETKPSTNRDGLLTDAFRNAKHSESEVTNAKNSEGDLSDARYATKAGDVDNAVTDAFKSVGMDTGVNEGENVAEKPDLGSVSKDGGRATTEKDMVLWVQRCTELTIKLCDP